VLFGPGSCSDGSQHTYGFNSADYDGSGTPTICAAAEYPSGLDSFGWCGPRLARSCFSTSCNDQDSTLFVVYIQFPSSRHTGYGKGKA
jgi:hypothetical protein